MNIRHMAVPILFAGLAGCYTGPKPVKYSPRLYMHQNQPREVWLTLKDGSKVDMVGPRVIDDTLFGWTKGANEDLTIALSDVHSMQARQIDPFRTALIPAAFVGAGIAVFTLVHHQSGIPDSSSGIYCPDGECDGL